MVDECVEYKDHYNFHKEFVRDEYNPHKDAIWKAVNSKLSSGMFKWIAGFIVLFCMGSGGAQITLLTQISEIKKDIAILQILIEKNNALQQKEVQEAHK